MQRSKNLIVMWLLITLVWFDVDKYFAIRREQEYLVLAVVNLAALSLIGWLVARSSWVWHLPGLAALGIFLGLVTSRIFG